MSSRRRHSPSAVCLRIASIAVSAFIIRHNLTLIFVQWAREISTSPVGSYVVLWLRSVPTLNSLIITRRRYHLLNLVCFPLLCLFQHLTWINWWQVIGIGTPYYCILMILCGSRSQLPFSSVHGPNASAFHSMFLWLLINQSCIQSWEELWANSYAQGAR